MPFVHYNLEAVRDALDAAALDRRRTGKVLCLSQPDLIVAPEELVRIFGPRAARLPARSDSAAIVNWHKAHKITTRVVDTRALFSALQVELTCLDLVDGRGGETACDLSDPLPEEHHGRYDVVFDCISNQCFNVAQAMANAAAACRVGGDVVHHVPCTMVNQGFWNVSPTAFRDFYEHNGFVVLRHELVKGVYRAEARLPFEPHRRLRGVPDDAVNFVVARKLEARAKVVWPVMRKFLLYPRCAAPTPEESPL